MRPFEDINPIEKAEEIKRFIKNNKKAIEVPADRICTKTIKGIAISMHKDVTLLLLASSNGGALKGVEEIRSDIINRVSKFFYYAYNIGGLNTDDRLEILKIMIIYIEGTQKDIDKLLGILKN